VVSCKASSPCNSSPHEAGGVTRADAEAAPSWQPTSPDAEAPSGLRTEADFQRRSGVNCVPSGDKAGVAGTSVFRRT